MGDLYGGAASARPAAGREVRCARCGEGLQPAQDPTHAMHGGRAAAQHCPLQWLTPAWCRFSMSIHDPGLSISHARPDAGCLMLRRRVPDECPAEVRQLILECLETRPSRRPSALQVRACWLVSASW